MKDDQKTNLASKKVEEALELVPAMCWKFFMREGSSFNDFEYSREIEDTIVKALKASL